MSDSDTPVALGNRKLVVLGIPWDVDTEGLRQFMSKYGELSDVIVMKDRVTGRSRGFGYVTFASSESAEKALGSSHFLNGRMLDVKIATPKEAIQQAPSSKKSSRIFVARVPLSVTDETFKSYFEKFGVITDAYMPKDRGSNAHRGIGFVTFEDADSVDKVMSETHQLGGATIAVDRATPKEDVERERNVDKHTLPYGVFNSYLSAAARLGFFAMPQMSHFDYPGYMGGSGGHGNPFGIQSSSGKGSAGLEHKAETGSYHGRGSSFSTRQGHKIFIGRLPLEATTDEVRSYFSKFGLILDVYLPKDKDKTTHRGFAFVTFAEERAVDLVVARTHEIRGQILAIDQAAPLGESPSAGSFYNRSMMGSGSRDGGPGPIRGSSMSESSNSGYSSLAGGYDYPNPWGIYEPLPTSSSKMEPRYRPY